MCLLEGMGVLFLSGRHIFIPACYGLAVRCTSRGPCGARRCGSPPIPKRAVKAPRSCLLYAGWSVGAVLVSEPVLQACHLPSLGTVPHPLSLFSYDDASDTGFFRRPRAPGSSSFHLWLVDSVHSPRASHPEKCPSPTQAAPPSCHCSNTPL